MWRSNSKDGEMLALIGKKIGMTQVFDDKGILTPVTVVEIEPNVVVGQRTEEKDGYNAIILGALPIKKKRVTKPYAGQFPEGIEPTRYLMEVRDFEGEVKVGDKLGVDLFENIRFVDVQGTTKGKGYQGVMKRHGFGGGRKSHGSKFHRAGGSTGQAAWPSKVLKGTKMAGRMGGVKATVQNLRVVRVDKERNLLLVKGAVPGRNKAKVVVRKSKKK